MLRFAEYKWSGRALRLAAIGALGMASSMLWAYSKPGNVNIPGPELVVQSTEPGAIVPSQEVDSIPQSEPRLRNRSRLYSLARSSAVMGQLNAVNGRLWSDGYLYSPDRARDELARKPVGQFYGVGFPDIRTYNPRPWEPMILWHKLNGKTSEPIALVRCMGLSPQAVARRAERYRSWIMSYAEKYKISSSLVKAVIAAESCFNHKALSPVGAQGLMQLMPRTASWLQVDDPHDPEENIRGGTRYLAALSEKFDSLELVLAAYNAGPGNVRRYGGIPPFKETRDYVKRVKAHYRRYTVVSRLSSRW